MTTPKPNVYTTLTEDRFAFTKPAKIDTAKGLVEDVLLCGLSASSKKREYTPAALGAAMADEPEVGRCAVNRVWNYAMSRGDIVDDLATLPASVTESFVRDFSSNGQNLKETIRTIFKSEDFVKF